MLAAADFLGRLQHLSRKAESRKLGTASEAYFAASLVADHLKQRLQRLQMAEGESEPYQALAQFLEREFTPSLEQVTGWCEAHLRAAGLSFSGELDWAQRTLSPSDFGFHNALRQPDGRIIFLDFEYFGWDDPAKMIADFLLHPAMNLSADAKRIFASTMFKRFPDLPSLPVRLEGLYPLFGLKWCLIFLNEFLPDAYLRRRFAATASAERSALQLRQLDKARQMLERIRQEYQCIAYRD